MKTKAIRKSQSKSYGLFFLIIVLSIVLFSVPNSFANISQDDFCNIINSSMTISQCNSLWEITTKNNVNNITQIINNSVNFSVNEHSEEIYNLLEDDITELIDIRINQYASDYGLDFSKYQYDKEYEYKMKLLELNSTKEECDIACQMKKTLQTQLEMELIRSQFCEIMPNLAGCKINPITNETIEESNDSNLNYKLTELENNLINLNNKLNSLDNQPKKESESNYFVIGLLIFIAIALALYGYFSNKKVQGIFLPKDKIESLQKNKDTINQDENQRKTLLELAKKRQLEKETSEVKKPLDFIK